jgi:hypothetical protein
MAIGQLTGASLSIGYRWNGSTWTLFRIPGVLLTSGSSTGSGSLSCTSSRFCMAVGTAQSSRGSYEVRAQWNGAKWLLRRGAAGSGSYLDSVSCTSAHWCLATGVDKSGADHEIWNGKTWSDQKSPGVGAPLSCAVTRVCTAIESEQSANSEQPVWLARHYARGSWSTTKQLPGGTSITPYGLSCVAPRACTLVGEVLSSTATAEVPLAERWD